MLYIYFKIFEGGAIVSGSGVGQGLVVVFLAEIISLPFYLAYIFSFLNKKGDVDEVDKFLFRMLVVHPVLIFVIGTSISWPFVVVSDNAQKKYDIEQAAIRNLNDLQRKESQEAALPSYEDAKKINVGTNIFEIEKEEDNQITSMYGIKNSDWYFKSKNGVSCKITDNYQCEKIEVVLKDGSTREIVFKVYNPNQTKR